MQNISFGSENQSCKKLLSTACGASVDGDRAPSADSLERVYMTCTSKNRFPDLEGVPLISCISIPSVICPKVFLSISTLPLDSHCLKVYLPIFSLIYSVLKD